MRCNGTLASGETIDTNCGVSSTIPFTLIAMVKYRTQNLFLQKKKNALPIILAPNVNSFPLHALFALPYSSSEPRTCCLSSSILAANSSLFCCNWAGVSTLLY